MRIQVDARLLRGGGIGRYIREVTGPWLAEPSVEALRFFGYPSELEPWLDEMDRRGIAEVVPWCDPPYHPRAQIRWPLLQMRFKWKADVTFFPHYDVPLLSHPTPSVVTIHDLIHFQQPEGFSPLKRWGGAVLMGGALNRAQRIVTVSEATRRALVARYPRVEPRIRVVRNGASEVFRPLTARGRREAETRWGDLMPFCLTVGPAKPHKNLATAVRAVATARREWTELQLVMVGLRPGDGNRLASEVGVDKSWIHDLGHVEDGRLRELYALCEALLSPSRLEGFGLPLVEAKASRTRVLAANTEVAREVLGSSEDLLDPDDADAWARSILRPPSHTGSPAPSMVETRKWQSAAAETLRLAKEAISDLDFP